MVQGMLAVEADGERLAIEAGETCLIEKGTRVIYSNASQEYTCEYWSLCLPAFRPERTNMGV